MALTIEEVTGWDLTVDAKDAPSASRKLRVQGVLPFAGVGDAFDHVASQVMAAVAGGAYATWYTPAGKLYWQTIQLHETAYATVYDVSVAYTPYDRQVGTYQISLDYGVGNQHVYGGTRLAGYAAAAADVVDNGGLIGVDGEEIKGIDIPVEESSLTVSFRHPRAFLNWDYIDRVCTLRGHPNSDTFLRWAAGEVMFLGGQFTQTEAEATALYRFALSKNRTNIVIGGITVASKAGWDVLSFTHFPTTSTAGGKTHAVRQIKCIEVIRAPGGMDWKAYRSTFGWG